MNIGLPATQPVVDKAATQQEIPSTNNGLDAKYEYQPACGNSTGNDHWLKTYWRPAAAWVYLAICICDFIVFPVIWSMAQIKVHATLSQWQPITLQGSGFIHITFATILGLAAWGRTKEKMAGSS